MLASQCPVYEHFMVKYLPNILYTHFTVNNLLNILLNFYYLEKNIP